MTYQHAFPTSPQAVPNRTAASPTVQPPRTTGGLFGRAIVALVVLAVLVIGAGGWAATAQLSGAVLAPGILVVESNARKVQHAVGGVIGDIRVRNGDRVAAGDILLRLNDVQVRADHRVLAARLLQLKGEKARLVAEREGNATVESEFASSDSDAATVIAAEQRLLDARRRLDANQKSRLRERVEQVRKEIAAIESQRDAKEREISLIRKDVRAVEDLYSRQLSTLARLLDSQRQLARFEGEHASLDAQLARAESRITEIELQILELEQRTMADAHKDMREVETRVEEISERLRAAGDDLARIELRAPAAGVVHELAVHTVGGVLRAGETAMLIVPDQDELSVEVRVTPSDIDQVRLGQPAILRLSALNQRTTPELNGRVIHVGADQTREPQSGRSYFTARIAIDESAPARLGSVKLVPGMPVEGFIETGARSALSYLIKPVKDSFARAMREP